MENQELLKYPIGRFIKPEIISENKLHLWIYELETFPERIKNLTKNVPVENLKWKYRENSWSIKQLVHHCADSHMNSFIRFKLALTEENPTIKPYEEQLWAELEDGLDDNIISSLLIIESVHKRWVLLLKSLTPQQFNRTFYHPGSKQKVSLSEATGLYAWHGNHHLAHIEQAISRNQSL